MIIISILKKDLLNLIDILIKKILLINLLIKITYPLIIFLNLNKEMFQQIYLFY